MAMRYFKTTPETAERYGIPGRETTWFLSTAEETEGRVTVMDSLFPKGTGVPWHNHEIDDELFYVVKGEFDVSVGDETFVLKPGECAIAGIGVPRRFESLSDDAQLLVITSPGGPAEGFIRHMQSLKGPPTDEDIKTVRKEYGVAFGKELD